VLLELGLLSNPDEFELVTNRKEQKKEARAIAQVLLSGLKSDR
jgi:N-acetylmuramoyl-L-alanine amidase